DDQQHAADEYGFNQETRYSGHCGVPSVDPLERILPVGEEVAEESFTSHHLDLLQPTKTLLEILQNRPFQLLLLSTPASKDSSGKLEQRHHDSKQNDGRNEGHERRSDHQDGDDTGDD